MRVRFLAKTRTPHRTECVPLIIHLTAVSGLCPSVAYFAEADHFAAAGLVAVVDLVVAVEPFAATGLVAVADLAAEADHFAVADHFALVDHFVAVGLVAVVGLDVAVDLAVAELVVAVVVVVVPARRLDSVRHDLAVQGEQGALPRQFHVDLFCQSLCFWRGLANNRDFLFPISDNASFVLDQRAAKHRQP